MSRHTNSHCCLCGAPRRPTQAPLRSFGNSAEVVRIADYRPLQQGRWESSPQLIASVSIWRNGGTDEHTHICDDCIIVGLKVAKRFVDKSLADLGVTDTGLAPYREAAE